MKKRITENSGLVARVPTSGRNEPVEISFNAILLSILSNQVQVM
jgi:hypothetical protein